MRVALIIDPKKGGSGDNITGVFKKAVAENLGCFRLLGDVILWSFSQFFLHLTIAQSCDKSMN